MPGAAPDQLQNDLHLREYRACYYGMITEVDDNLGRLFAALDDFRHMDTETFIEKHR